MCFKEAGCGYVAHPYSYGIVYRGLHCSHRTDAGLIESFGVKAGLHQGYVLILLLFSVVMDVVSSEVRGGMPSDLLYADDLVLMAPTMEQFSRCVA